ncbi:GNAT family N-acetyltransferase [Nitrospirillum sp. BR 11828]|uniref:GNAT family N-acetyltransferase n=1 Tax=Nitrospirillum sp. BR 11828 TaxID=3104325 RepID=UPI002ACAFE50|nr:GNAT family N-acetyltransferase [Nitrospirillum sp. BR 11828]MDZ5648267.1 GNAT family N-acetyltransferase [Nitrospirillum sp. BR 11828]
MAHGPAEIGLVRPATVADAAAIARVHVASWRTTYPGQLPDDYLVGLSPEGHAQRWRGLLAGRQRRTFVAVGENIAADGLPATGVVGFATCGAQRTEIRGYEGEFYAIYLYDHAQNQGHGRRLMAAMATELMSSGMRSACVWVLRDNPARWFYERLGGSRLAEQPITFAGARLTEVAYGWLDLAPLARLSSYSEG